MMGALSMDMSPSVALTILVWTLFSILCQAQSLLPITAAGSKLFDSSGKQFFIRGMCYAGPFQEGADDPLSVPEQCELDASLMKNLLVNTIRVYSVNNEKSHDQCMKIFEEHGIYVVISLDTAMATINRADPKWDEELFKHYTKTLDAFAKYDNLLAVYIGTETINESFDSGSSQDTAPLIKAAARDVKAYRDAQLYRKIPVGYSAADVLSTIDILKDYLICGGDNSSTIDFFALNKYSWCSASDTFTTSGYSSLYEKFLDYPVPIFLSETGCKIDQSKRRRFDDQIQILHGSMLSNWSGSFIYEWQQDVNDYGIVQYSSTASGDFEKTGTPTPISPAFYNLLSQWITLTPTGVSLTDYTPASNTVSCPATTSGDWTIDGDKPLPTIRNLVIPSKVAESGTTASITPAPNLESQAALSTASATATTASDGNQSSGLPIGAKIAIGVLVPIVGCVAAIVAFMIYRRRRRVDTADPVSYSEVQQETEPVKPELHSDSRYAAQLPSNEIHRELDGSQRYQLYDEPGNPSELNSSAEPQEMSASASVRRKP